MSCVYLRVCKCVTSTYAFKKRLQQGFAIITSATCICMRKPIIITFLQSSYSYTGWIYFLRHCFVPFRVRANSPSLRPTILEYICRFTNVLPLCTLIDDPTISGIMCDRRLQVYLFGTLLSTKTPFFIERVI
jgi:hypothetical protein